MHINPKRLILIGILLGGTLLSWFLFVQTQVAADVMQRITGISVTKLQHSSISNATSSAISSTFRLTDTPYPTDGWAQYNDPVLEFSINYPSEWFLYPAATEGYAKTTILSSFDLQAAAPTEGKLEPGEIRFGFSRSYAALETVQEQAERIEENYLHPSAKVTSRREVLIDGYSGILFDFELFDQREVSIFIQHEGELFFINVIGIDVTTIALFEEIIATIQFS